MDSKENADKPLLPPPPGEATKRMWDQTAAAPAHPRPAESAADATEVKCDYCGSIVKIRRGQRCPICTM